MTEIIKEFIGKEVIISTMKTEIIGVVESVEGNWIRVSSGVSKSGGADIVNVDYVSRVRELPHKKNGKKKLILG